MTMTQQTPSPSFPPSSRFTDTPPPTNPYQKHSLIRTCMRRLQKRSGLCLNLTLSLTLLCFMVGSLFQSKRAAAAVSSSSPVAVHSNPSLITAESRLRAALWGFFSGDALAAPTHWYYGGFPQIQADYGLSGITDYTKPKMTLKGSIMNKSNTNGGGRGSFSKTGVSIIGGVINHGKLDYWDPKKQIHYHATLQKGENTLEAQLARVLMKSIVASGGKFNPDHFLKAYVDFMMKPGSHNDTYASTCHRMFFANLVLRKLPPERCPDNDQHNVETIDGLVLPTIVALAATSPEDAALSGARTASLTRNSRLLESTSEKWSQLVFHALRDRTDEETQSHLETCARKSGVQRKPSDRGPDQMTACYLSSSFPPTLNMLSKYIPKQDAWTGLIANANVGGENVHRGSLLGTVLGARAGLDRMPPKLIDGLHDRQELEREIDAFVRVVMDRRRAAEPDIQETAE